MTSRPMGCPVSNLRCPRKDAAAHVGFYQRTATTTWETWVPACSLPLRSFACHYGAAPWANFVFTRKALKRTSQFSKYFWTSNLTFWTQKPRKAPLRPLRKRRSFSVWGKITFVSFVLKDHAKLQQYAQLMRVSLSIYLYLYNNFPISDSRSR